MNVACKHYFKNLGGLWTCACGEQRDRYGHPIKSKKVGS